MSKEYSPFSSVQEMRQLGYIVPAESIVSNDAILNPLGALVTYKVIEQDERGKKVFISKTDPVASILDTSSIAYQRVFDSLGRFKVVWQESLQPGKRLFDKNAFAKTESETLTEEQEFELFKQFIVDRIKPVYDLVNPSLDAVNEFGFNAHDWENHVSYVTEKTLEILESFGKNIDLETKKKAFLFAASHDLGNLLKREGHQDISPYILAYRIPEILDAYEDEEQQNRFLEEMEHVVKLHDEKAAKKYLSENFKPNAQGGYDFQEIREKFGDIALALLIADKSHALDRNDRMTRKYPKTFKQAVNPLDRDTYHITTLSSKYVSLDYNSRQNGKLCWRVDFNPYYSDDEVKNISENFMRDTSDTSVSSGKRLYMDQKTHNEFRRLGIPYMNRTLELVLAQDLGRIEIMALAAFALDPTLETFEFVYRDTNGYSQESGPRFTLYISRDNIADSIERIKEYAYKEKDVLDQPIHPGDRPLQQAMPKREEIIKNFSAHGCFAHTLEQDRQGRPLLNYVILSTLEDKDAVLKHLKHVYKVA